MQPTRNMTSKSTPLDRSRSSSVSSIDEAQNLIQRCAAPRPAGDSVDAAINRTARRLKFTHSRAKSIWYREAHSIHAYEMDQLRRCAAGAQFEQAVAGLKVIRNRLAAMSPSPKCREVIEAIDKALNSKPMSRRSGEREQGSTRHKAPSDD